MRILILIFLLLALIQPIAAQRDEFSMPDIRPFRLVVIGSSTAAGAGAKPYDSAWVKRYEHFLKLLYPHNQVINLAKRGHRSYQLLPNGSEHPANRPAPDTLRNITRALALKPDAILVCLPSNDIAAGYNIAEQLANFEIIKSTAQLDNVPVWFSTTQPRNFESSKINLQLMLRDSILKRYPGRSIDFWKALADSNGRIKKQYNAGDGIHLNNAGHKLLYQRVRANILTQIPLARQRELYTNERVWAQTVPINLQTFRPPPPKASESPTKPKPGTILLRADRPIDGVTVEIFNASGRPVRKLETSLPALVKTNFGPKGVYWIQMHGPNFSRLMKWVKTD